MKALLICPDERNNVSALAEKCPLAVTSVLSKPLICYWLEYLAHAGATEVLVLAADRPEQIRNVTQDGRTWGLKIEVLAQSRELSPAEAREKFCSSGEWLQSPDNVSIVDCFPDFRDEPLFESYQGYFSTILRKLPLAASRDRIGIREVKPGVIAGFRSVIHPLAQIHAPCWIGENVQIGKDAVVGPNAVLEKNILVEDAATISNTHVAPETYVGSMTEITFSLVQGALLTNWKTGSTTAVTDSFLLSAMGEQVGPVRKGTFTGRVVAAMVLLLTAPVALLTIARSLWKSQRPYRVRRAARPLSPLSYSDPILYYELNNAAGLWKRWPQMLNIALGEFSWVGNRPLAPLEAAKLQSDFERMWLAAPIGLFSQADVEGSNGDDMTEENKAHSSFYAAQATIKLDLTILRKALGMLIRGDFKQAPLAEEIDPKTRTLPLGQTLIR